MHKATLFLSMVILSGCAGTGSHQRSQPDTDCVGTGRSQQKLSLLQRMGLGLPSAKKTELLPPVATERTSRDAFGPVGVEESAPFVRPGSLSIEPAMPRRSEHDADDAGEK
jgi:hypothetical protein